MPIEEDDSVRGFVLSAGRMVRVAYPREMGEWFSRLSHELELLIPLVEEVTNRELYAVYVQGFRGDRVRPYAFKFVFKADGGEVLAESTD